jgi:Domain of unknown function (DUF4105)
MNKILSKKTLLILVFLISNCGFSQYYKLSNNSKISILTCGSGSELYSIYGHTAIRILDNSNNLDVVYNYGNFDFGVENFYGKFVKGDLQYFVATCSFQDFINEYIQTDRTVWEQKLILNDFQKQKLFDELNKSLFSEERFYTYKFIDKNCTTMVLDKVNSIFGSQVVSKKNDINISYRTVLYQYVANHFWENFGINIIFGSKVDNNATKLFLPDELLQNLKTSKHLGKSISENASVLYKKSFNSEYFSFWNSIYPFCLFLIILVLINKNPINYFYFAILGLAGIFFSLVGFYSYHEEIRNNYNVLLFNPSLLILIYFMIIKNYKWVIYLSWFNLISLVIYIIMLTNKVHLIMMLPMILCSGIILIRIIISNKKLLTTVK